MIRLYYDIEQTPLGVNSQTCHKPLILSISLTPPPFNSSNKSVERKLSFRPASKKQIKIAKYVSTQLSSLIENGTSPDYFLLTQVLSDAKSRYLLSSHKSKYPRVSKNILKLQKQFYAAIRQTNKERSDLSAFNDQLLEELLYDE